MKSIKSLVALVASAFAIYAPGALAQAPVKVQLGDLAQALNSIASNVMIQQGFDKKHGIALEYTTYPTLDGLFTAIRGKQVDVGFGGWTAFAQFRSKGFPVTMFFPIGRGVTLDVIAPKGSTFKSLADLKGRKVGSYAGAAGTATVLFRVLTTRYYGYDPAKTNDLQYAGPGLLPSLVEKNEVAAALLFDPLAAKAISTGPFRSIANLADVYKEKVGEDFLWIGVASNDDFIAKHPAALSGFVRAWIDSVAYVKANPAVFDPYAKALGLDAAGTKILRDRVLADYTTTWNDGTIKALGNFAKMANEVMGGGFLDEVPAAAFTTRFNPR
jgi:ABC-type nitrate/sulfonate/bicarbonate transport system substrate-binding protein